MKPELMIKKIVARAVMNGWGSKENFYSVGKADTDEPELRITDKNNGMKVQSFTYIIFSHDFARKFWPEGLEWQARLQSLATADNRLQYLYQFI